MAQIGKSAVLSPSKSTATPRHVSHSVCCRLLYIAVIAVFSPTPGKSALQELVLSCLLKHTDTLDPFLETVRGNDLRLVLEGFPTTQLKECVTITTINRPVVAGSVL